MTLEIKNAMQFRIDHEDYDVNGNVLPQTTDSAIITIVFDDYRIS